MRKILAMLAAVSLAACGPASTATGSTFVLYHDFDSEAIGPIVAAFKQYYRSETGKDLEISTYHQPGGELRVTLDLEANANQVKPDVVMMAHTELAALRDKHDMFRQLTVKGLADPAIRPEFREPLGSYAVPNSAQPYLIAYNTDKVAPAEVPASWADLLDSKWRDQLGLGDPESTSGAHLPLWS